MNRSMLFVAGTAALASLSICAQAGLSNFYITDSSGLVYEVDGATLAATEVVQLDNAGSINEILYLGGNQLMYNAFGLLSVTDLATGLTEEVFNANDFLGPGINYANGLAMTQSGDIYLAIESISAQSDRSYGALINIENQTLTELADFDHLEFYLDSHQVEENLFAHADWGNGTIDLIHTDTGEILSELSFGFDPVSFFEADGFIYVIAKEGGLYTYDYLQGSVEFLGNVTGAGTDIIGATVPGPASIYLIGIAGFTGVRRRR